MYDTVRPPFFLPLDVHIDRLIDTFENLASALFAVNLILIPLHWHDKCTIGGLPITELTNWYYRPAEGYYHIERLSTDRKREIAAESIYYYLLGDNDD